MTAPEITVPAAIMFLETAARYFESRPTGGEDQAHWANVYNAQNCRQIARLLVESPAPALMQGGEP